MASNDATTVRTYHIRRDVKRLYVAAGLLMCLAVGAVLVLRPAHFEKTYYNVLFYGAAIVVAVLSMTRFKTCHLTLSKEELYFYNGIIDTRRIPLQQIERVEYNPEIRIRIYLRSARRREMIHRIPNVFSQEDTHEILETLANLPGVEVRRIEKSDLLKPAPGKEVVAKRSAEEAVND